MRKLALVIAVVLPALIVHLAHVHRAGRASDGVARAAQLRRGAAEIGPGKFVVFGSANPHPIAFVWVREDTNGDPLETWLLFREHQADGWVYPSATSGDVTITFQHASPSGIDDMQDFREWAENQYDASQNVDESTDFGEHLHEVTIK